MSDQTDNLPAIIGRDKRGAIVLAAAIAYGIDADLSTAIADVLANGGTIETTTKAGVRAAVDRDGWATPPGAEDVEKQLALFEE